VPASISYSMSMIFFIQRSCEESASLQIRVTDLGIKISNQIRFFFQIKFNCLLSNVCAHSNTSTQKKVTFEKKIQTWHLFYNVHVILQLLVLLAWSNNKPAYSFARLIACMQVPLCVCVCLCVCASARVCV
jgi:uncharacterized integral membrane protein